jgi:hypothetical protein
MMARRALRPDRSAPLPQFSFPVPSDYDITVEMEVGDADKTLEIKDKDPDKTLKRPSMPAAAEVTPAVRPVRGPSKPPVGDREARRARQAPAHLAPPKRNADATQEIRAEDVIEEAPAQPKAASTQEIEAVDILEVVDSARPVAAPPPQATSPLPLVTERRTPTSMAPVAMEVYAESRAETAFFAPNDDEPSLSWLPRRRVGWVAATVAAAAMGILVAGLTAHSSDGSGVAVAAQPPVTAKRAPAPTKPAHTDAPANGASGVPVIAVDSLPRAPVGTVTGSSEHRLYIDGYLMRSYSAVVRCGRHTVKVGHEGVPQSVDVPCGAEILVR